MEDEMTMRAIRGRSSGGASWTTEAYDYVIVGAGTAGCVLADRLSETPETRVLVLEAGGSDLNPYISLPVGFVKIGSKFHWGYEPEPDPSRGDKVQEWPAGKVLGGSSSVNATGWLRGHAADYDEWSKMGCAGWDYQTLLPYFRRSEKFTGAVSEYRGREGKIKVRYSGLHHRLTDAFIEGAEQQGHVFRVDINRGTDDGVGYMQVSQRRGLRSSAASAYLRGARRRSNVTVRKNALATKVIVENGRAVGVEYVLRGRVVRSRAEREVILSAGAIGSAKLLLLSGIGPADHLRSKGIEVVADLGGVGANMQEHARASMVYSVHTRTVNMDLNPVGFIKHGLDFLLRGQGPATTSPTCAVVLAKLSPERQRPDFQFLFAPFAVIPAPRPNSKVQSYRDVAIPRTPLVMSSVWLNHPRARGTVRLRSADPAARPVIEHVMFENKEDLTELAAGLRALRSVFSSDAFGPYVRQEVSPGPDVNSDEEFEQYVRKYAAVGHHTVGTCSMGTGPLAVVDPELRVNGVRGLRVVDASVMPTLVSGQTYAPVVMLAERASDLIRTSRAE